ncbi:hypothetical protein MTO96_043552 [Rhipicephalus appendiculatus]
MICASSSRRTGGGTIRPSSAAIVRSSNERSERPRTLRREIVAHTIPGGSKKNKTTTERSHRNNNERDDRIRIDGHRRLTSSGSSLARCVSPSLSLSLSDVAATMGNQERGGNRLAVNPLTAKKSALGFDGVRRSFGRRLYVGCSRSRGETPFDRIHEGQEERLPRRRDDHLCE